MDDIALRKRLKKAGIIVLLLIFTIIAIGGLFAQYLHRSQQNTVRSQMIMEAEEYRERILGQLDNNLEILTTLASFLDAENTADRGLLAEKLNAANSKNSLLTLVYSDVDGNTVISTRGREPVPNATLSDLSDEGRRAIKHSFEGISAISFLFKSTVTNDMVFVYSVPVRSGDEVIGALAASDSIDVFSDILSGNTVFGGEGYIHLLNSKGDFLLRSSNAVVPDGPSTIFDGPYIPAETQEQVYTSMQNQERVSSSFEYGGNTCQLLLEPVGVNNWYLCCVNTGEGLIKSFHSSLLVTRIVFALALFLWIALMLYGYFLYRRYNKRLESFAYFDPVTGAKNMVWFRQRLPVFLKNSGGSVVKMCVRQFPFLEEIFGRKKSVHFLRQVKEIADRHVRSDEFFSHDTDDYFYFLLKETDKEVIRRRLNALLLDLDTNVDIGNTYYQLTFYCGVSICDGSTVPEKSAELLMAHVQFALEKAKGAHSNFIWFFDSELHIVEERENYIESHMYQALRSGEFKLFLQPKQNLHTGRMEGAEALVRWKPSDGRVLFPDQFIPLFEKNGFCVELDFYMIEQACRLIRSWIDRGIEPVPISVNQSKLVFFERNYVELLGQILQNYRIPAQFIVLEILEGLAFDNIDLLNERILALQTVGFHISLDDFGSGYSSMNTLSRLNIDELKLDRGFLLNNNRADRERNSLIMEQMIHLCHKLGISTVAEGVETPEDEELVRSIGCDVGQGYLYHAPISSAEFTAAYMTHITDPDA